MVKEHTTHYKDYGYSEHLKFNSSNLKLALKIERVNLGGLNVQSKKNKKTNFTI